MLLWKTQKSMDHWNIAELAFASSCWSLTVSCRQLQHLIQRLGAPLWNMGQPSGLVGILSPGSVLGWVQEQLISHQGGWWSAGHIPTIPFLNPFTHDGLGAAGEVGMQNVSRCLCCLFFPVCGRRKIQCNYMGNWALPPWTRRNKP